MSNTYEKLRAWLDVDRTAFIEAQKKLEEAFATIGEVCERTGISFSLNLSKLINIDPYYGSPVDIDYFPKTFGVLGRSFYVDEAADEMRDEGISDSDISAIVDEFYKLTGNDALCGSPHGQTGWVASINC